MILAICPLLIASMMIGISKVKPKVYEVCNINPYGGMEEYRKYSIWKERKS